MNFIFKIFDLTKIKTLYNKQKILIKPKLNQDILNEDNFEFQNKFSKIKESESKKEIELKEKNKRKDDKQEGNNLILNKNIQIHHRNVFSLEDFLFKKENEKFLLSTISDNSETSDESQKRFSKMKKKVTFGRMVKVIIYKKNEGDNKLKKNQKISNDGDFIKETYMKFL